MRYVTGISAVLFALCAPIISIAGLLTCVGVGGPAGLAFGALLMTGVFLLRRKRRV
jgi:MYXO-CTERM domain-containing protein